MWYSEGHWESRITMPGVEFRWNVRLLTVSGKARKQQTRCVQGIEATCILIYSARQLPLICSQSRSYQECRVELELSKEARDETRKGWAQVKRALYTALYRNIILNCSRLQITSALERPHIARRTITTLTKGPALLTLVHDRQLRYAINYLLLFPDSLRVWNCAIKSGACSPRGDDQCSPGLDAARQSSTTETRLAMHFGEAWSTLHRVIRRGIKKKIPTAQLFDLSIVILLSSRRRRRCCLELFLLFRGMSPLVNQPRSPETQNEPDQAKDATSQRQLQRRANGVSLAPDPLVYVGPEDRGHENSDTWSRTKKVVRLGGRLLRILGEAHIVLTLPQ